jgi:hypothetical protein
MLGPELKTIISMTERLKKLSVSNESLSLENEEIKAGLQVSSSRNDFLSR